MNEKPAQVYSITPSIKRCDAPVAELFMWKIVDDRDGEALCLGLATSEIYARALVSEQSDMLIEMSRLEGYVSEVSDVIVEGMH